jgi:hypothetical protein
MKKVIKLSKLVWVPLVIAILTLAGCSSGNQTQNQRHQSFGPESFNIGTGSGDFSINSINVSDRVEFNFTVAGAPVTYSVQDPNGKTIFIGRGGYHFLQKGRGYFIASTAGDYKLHFVSSGIGTPSVLTINYTIYFAQ